MTIQDKLYEPETKAQEFLLKYGSSVYRTESGRKIIQLPTCTVPLNHLIEENWDKKIGYGNFRSVEHINKLVNGEETFIYVKGPEYNFTAKQRLLQEGYFWWGGIRSGEEYIRVYTDVVEEQVEWEAVFLLELHKHGIHAEIPQALVEDKGRKEVIVQGIRMYYWHSDAKSIPEQPSEEDIFNTIDKTGLVPSHDSRNNMLRNEDGYNFIIDVNRWEWPPYTDDFRNRLLKTIQEEVKKIKKN